MLDRLRSWVSNADDEENSIPPKPEPEAHSETFELPVDEVTVTYRNGDTETFESYGRYSTDEHTITYNVEPNPRRRRQGTRDASYAFDRRTIHYRVLAREPQEQRLRTETWELSWTVEYRRDEHPVSGRFRQWEPKPTDVTIERVDGDAEEVDDA